MRKAGLIRVLTLLASIALALTGGDLAWPK